jgi:hypothetical protein
MPITTEDEPEDVDDDAPSRVCFVQLSSDSEAHYFIISPLSVLSMVSQRLCHRLKSSLPCGSSFNSISPLQTQHIGVAQCLLLACPSKAAASI